MAAEPTEIPSPIADGGRTIVALAERVAIVETKVGALKEDTGIIRATQHATNNEMQRFVAAEQLCAANLARLIDAQGITNRQISELTSAVDTLTAARHHLDGAWSAVSRMAVLIGSVLAGSAAVIAGIMWALGHLAVKVST